MAIDTSLLIAAPMLQDYLVDKDTGTPLVNGIVSMYQDTARNVYKNWYYQTGVPGNYTWVQLDNPLYLSSVGTIQDPNGNDVIPFYYPYDENDENTPQPYYVTVYSSDEDGDPAILQFTRENFPYNVQSSNTNTGISTNRNYILNNVYWRNLGSADLTDMTDVIVAPSQHEGYTNGDIRFIKSTAGATDTITFMPMTNTLTNDITPEYYLNMQCSALEDGETQKAIQYPISLHVKTLQNVQATLVLPAQNVSGNTNNYLSVYIYQFFGTGSLTPSVLTPIITNLTIGNTFQNYILPFTFPDASAATLGLGGDDALFLVVQYPLSSVFNINHTKPQIYLSNTVPVNDFDTYDQIETIINSPRTGDFRISGNLFQPWGYVPANNGTIGSSSSGASTRANTDTWPLYNLIWTNYVTNWAPVVGGRGTTAYDDFSANKPITLTQQLGRVISGANGALPISVSFTASSATSILTFSDSVSITAGTPVQVYNSGGALPSPLVANTVYFVSITSLTDTTIILSTTLENALAGTNITLSTDGSGTNNLASAMGAYLGESNHVLSVPELAAHTHTYAEVGMSGGTIGIVSAGTGYTSFTGTSGTTGSSTGHNTIQPTVYQNIYIKL